MANVVGYTRVSTTEQADSGLGLAAQELAIREACERKGDTLVRIVTDAGLSGKNLHGRPALMALLDELDAGLADGLVAAKLDRVSRSVVDTAGLMDRASRKGWTLNVLDIAVDTSTPGGELYATIIAAFAQHERKLIGERTRKALAVKKAQGVTLGRPRLLDPAVRERIVAARAAGRTLRSIADELTADGVPTAQGGVAWYPATVRKIAQAA